MFSITRHQSEGIRDKYPDKTSHCHSQICDCRDTAVCMIGLFSQYIYFPKLVQNNLQLFLFKHTSIYQTVISWEKQLNNINARHLKIISWEKRNSKVGHQVSSLVTLPWINLSSVSNELVSSSTRITSVMSDRIGSDPIWVRKRNRKHLSDDIRIRNVFIEFHYRNIETS